MVKLEASTLSAVCDALAEKDGQERSIVNANPDIAGPGVAVGFIGTAGLMLLMTSAYYLVAFDPTKDPFRARRQTPESSQQWAPNSVDKHVFELMTTLRRWLSRLLGLQTRILSRESVEHAFVACVLHLSDAQILTGIGILVSAYGSLDAGITIYHWRVAVYLAWYANMTHQSGLVFLRAHLNDPRRRLQRHVRVVMMVLLTALLVAAMIPTAYFDWTTYYLSPAGFGDYAWCFVNIPTANRMLNLTLSPGESLQPLQHLRDLRSFQDMILSLSLLVCTFAVKLSRLSMRMSAFAGYSQRHVRRWYDLLLQKAAGDNLCNLLHSNAQRPTKTREFLRWHFIIQPLLALYLMVHIYVEFMTSMMWEICWLWISVIFLSLNFSLLRLSGSRFEQESDDSIFSFGQILSIMLLAGPLLVITTEILSAIGGDNAARSSEATSSQASVTSIPNNGSSPQSADEHEAKEGQSQIEEIHTPFQSPATPCSSGDWPTCGHHHRLGSRWVVALLLIQLWYISSTTTFTYLGEGRPVRTIQKYLPWFLITHPSAVYLMTAIGLDARGSKRAMVPALLFLSFYVASMWPFLIDSLRYLSVARGMETHMWDNGLFHFLVMVVIVALYLLCVCVMAGVMKLSRRRRQRGILSGRT
ncbi:hypothetical protein QBC34DRAFT_496340 [Podospora aff. communis PSN243]|uniref:Uncharacterized protein n=1 Tax=Podospora aff. communis PSN243 TaxID=3040156 RepID=A0AAV9GEL8_9PEZI|nr:hypothetical protein QBC34DRAFT_496340 [Podospora aff. communis PSN243]